MLFDITHSDREVVREGPSVHGGCLCRLGIWPNGVFFKLICKQGSRSAAVAPLLILAFVAFPS